MSKVAIMGYGTIGSGVAEVLEKNRQIITDHAGEEVTLKYILDLRDFPGDPNEDKLVHDVEQILNDPEVTIVVETMGGVEPAYTFVKKMLLAGKSVTTSNKALVAEKGAELIRIAREKDLNFQFEASVGGGIPIIRSMNKCLTADVIEEISGILNGTTNYMLSKMYDEGGDYDTVLREAQALGYAERDPSNDVEGWDACRKIAILTSLASGRQVDFGEIHTEGITKITADDILCAKALGRKIRLVAQSRRQADGSYDILVAPFLLSPEHPLYTVNGVFNAVFVHGNMLGDAMFYGSGAGKLPTASAVVADIVDITKHPHRNIPVLWDEERLTVPDYRKTAYRYLVRADEERGAVETAFPGCEILDAPLSQGVSAVTAPMDGSQFGEAAKKVRVANAIRLK